MSGRIGRLQPTLIVFGLAGHVGEEDGIGDGDGETQRRRRRWFRWLLLRPCFFAETLLKGSVLGGLQSEKAVHWIVGTWRKRNALLIC